MVSKAFLCWKYWQPYWKMATIESLDVFLSLRVFFMMITRNKLTQRSFRLKHGSYMYIICVSEMAAILNMATKEAFGFTIRAQYSQKHNTKYQTIQIRPVDPMLWKTYFLRRPSLKMAAILIF